MKTLSHKKKAGINFTRLKSAFGRFYNMLVSSAADFLGEVTVGKALRDIPEKGAVEGTYNMLDSIFSPFVVRSSLSRQNS